MISLCFGYFTTKLNCFHPIIKFDRPSILDTQRIHSARVAKWAEGHDFFLRPKVFCFAQVIRFRL